MKISLIIMIILVGFIVFLKKSMTIQHMTCKQNKFIISFPRSGQHLMDRILSTSHKKYGLNYSYCAFYDCCQEIPCKYRYLFHKNHDLNIDLKINDNNKYLVLYRDDIIYQLESYFRWDYGARGKNKNKITFNYNDPKLFNKLIIFIKKNIKYYINFKKKWVNNNHKNILKIKYNDIIKNPIITITKIMNFFYNNKFTVKSFNLNDYENIEYKSNLSKNIYMKIKNIIE